MNKKWFTAEDFNNPQLANDNPKTHLAVTRFVADVANAKLQGLYRALEVYEEALGITEKVLDGIKYDLEASVYTLEDDEFAQVFFIRDTAHKALETVKGILNNEEKK